MRKLIILLLLIPLGLGAQNIKNITRSGVNNRRDASRINNTIDTANALKSIYKTDATLEGVRYIDYDLEDGWVMKEGRAGWNDDDKTLEVGLERGSVLQMGQELHVRATNKTGSPISDGQVVYVSGASGNKPTITLANNENAATSFTTIGIATQDIANNQTGYVTLFGLTRGIKTDDWPEGSILWLDSIDGAKTDVRPIAPNIAVVIGVVLRSHATEGIIGVRIIPVFRLAWLSDVKAQGAQTHWDILYWNNDSLRWELNDGVIVVDSIAFGNGASIDNSETDTIYITETVTKVMGELLVTGHVYEGEHASGQTFVSTPGTQTIGTGGTFERLNEGTIAYTGDHLHEFTHDDGRLTYTSPTEISMTVAATVSVESGEVTQVINFRIAKNGTTIASTNMPVTFNAVNTNAAVPLFTLVDMEQNDYVEVWATSDTNGDEIIINNLTMGITKH